MSQQNLFDETTDTDWKNFRESMKQESKNRRVSNLDNSLLMLAEEGIDFVSSNQGVHCVIEDHSQVWDFWPTTGKYAKRVKSGTVYKRGVMNLIAEIKKARPIP